MKQDTNTQRESIITDSDAARRNNKQAIGTAAVPPKVQPPTTDDGKKPSKPSIFPIQEVCGISIERIYMMLIMLIVMIELVWVFGVVRSSNSKSPPQTVTDHSVPSPSPSWQTVTDHSVPSPSPSWQTVTDHSAPIADPNNEGVAVGAAGDLLELELKNVKWRFRWCPAGSLVMDGDKVALKQGFYMAETQVTQEQWQVIMGSNPSYFKGGQLPVEMVSWDDCQKFVQKLNEFKGVPAGYKFSLPAVTQWQYACRAVSIMQRSEYAWYSGNSRNKTQPVGTKEANEWGLYDMYGNVWEWCEDSPYVYLWGQAVPSGRRDVCGGGWSSDTAMLGSRYSYEPGTRYSFLGLRVALVSKGK